MLFSKAIAACIFRGSSGYIYVVFLVHHQYMPPNARKLIQKPVWAGSSPHELHHLYYLQMRDLCTLAPPVSQKRS